MNLTISFDESVKGCTKVAYHLYRLLISKESALAQTVEELAVNQELSHKNAEHVMVLECRLSDKEFSQWLPHAGHVEELDRKSRIFVQPAVELESRRKE